MKVVKRKISELIPADYNPRRLTEKQEKHLTESLTEFGLVDPVIVNMNSERKNIIIGGHQRLKVWQKLGNKEIDCVELDLSIEKEKELNIRLNANTGEWDIDLLTSEWDKFELEEWGVDIEWAIGSDLDIDELSDEFELPEGDREPFQQMTFTLADEQAEFLKSCISELKQTEEYKYIETFGNENSNGNALYLIAHQWNQK